MAYRPTEKTEARKREQHQRLLQAALDIVSRQGFRALTIAALANEANVAAGTVYKYFENKADLCTQVFRMGSEKGLQQVRNAASGPHPAPNQSSCLQRLSLAVTSFAKRALTGHRLAYALIVEPVDPMVAAERLKYRHAYAAIFEALIEEGIGRKELRPQDASVSAAAMVGALAEILVRPLDPDASTLSKAAADKLVASIDSFCMQALRHPKSESDF